MILVIVSMIILASFLLISTLAVELKPGYSLFLKDLEIPIE